MESFKRPLDHTRYPSRVSEKMPYHAVPDFRTRDRDYVYQQDRGIYEKSKETSDDIWKKIVKIKETEKKNTPHMFDPDELVIDEEIQK